VLDASLMMVRFGRWATATATAKRASAFPSIGASSTSFHAQFCVELVENLEYCIGVLYTPPGVIQYQFQQQQHGFHWSGFIKIDSVVHSTSFFPTVSLYGT
jgi:hypothetical protein